MIGDDDGAAAWRLDPIAVDAALDRIARRDAAPWLHGEIARRLGERLPVLAAKPTRIVDWWSWQGAASAILADAYPDAERVAVEPSARHAANGVRAARRPWWRLGRAPGALLDDADDAAIGPAQMIWANRVLDHAPDPPALFARWSGLLEADGVLLFSALGPGSLPELRAIYASARWPAPTPGFVDMHDLGDMMVRAGFVEPVLDQETIALAWADAPTALAELRTLGGNTAPDRFQGLRTPRWRARLEAALAERAAADGRIRLTFEVAYGHGFKGRPRRAPGAAVEVGLDRMREMLGKRRSGSVASG